MPKRKTIREKRSARKWRVALILLCLIALGLLIFIIFFSPLFRVKKLSFKMDSVGCTSESEIKNSIGLVGQWIFTFNNSFQSELKRKFLCIREVKTKIILPNTLEINVSGRKPLAVIKILNSEASSAAVLADPLPVSSESAKAARQLFLDFSKLSSETAYIVDSEGVVFASGESTSVPSLFLSGRNLKLGETVRDELVGNAVFILSSLSVLNVNPVNSKLVGSTLVINSEPKLLFALVRDIKDQLASLQLILQEAKMEDATMEIIDLRFNNPVVKYKVKGAN